jgi:hypothetical protein
MFSVVDLLHWMYEKVLRWNQAEWIVIRFKCRRMMPYIFYFPCSSFQTTTTQELFENNKPCSFLLSHFKTFPNPHDDCLCKCCIKHFRTTFSNWSWLCNDITLLYTNFCLAWSFSILNFWFIMWKLGIS